MGLDLVVEGCAKPGFELEWRRMMTRYFAEDELTEAEIARFQDISIPGYERIGAPRVGFDTAADEWIIKARGASTPEAAAAVLKEFHGYHALRLVKCDGVPAYSNAGLYDGIDETSFRGAFLKDCQGVLAKDLLNAAWANRMPEAAVSYGQALLTAADTAGRSPSPEARKTIWSRLGLAKNREPIPLAEQLNIVTSAGRWFVFWGERGHPIRAWT